MNDRKSAMAFFTDRSIGTKIAAGFTAILLILALSSALAYAAFGRVADAVGVFGGLVANSAIYTDIDRLTALYRGHVREFVASTDAAVATGAVKEGEALRQLIADGLTKITHPERRRLLEDAGKQADLYATASERMRVMEAEQVKLEKDVLDVVGQQVTDGLTTVATGAAKADNVDVQRLATEARRVSLLVRLDVNKRLGRHDETAAKSADEQFAARGQLLAQLDTATKDRDSNTTLKSIGPLVGRYQSAFRRADDLEREEVALVNGAMKQARNTLSTDVEKARESNLAEQATTEKDAIVVLGSGETRVMVLGLVGLRGCSTSLAYRSRNLAPSRAVM